VCFRRPSLEAPVSRRMGAANRIVRCGNPMYSEDSQPAGDRVIWTPARQGNRCDGEHTRCKRTARRAANSGAKRQRF
jgi:hypothetical protein